jgi:hypothetical protein
MHVYHLQVRDPAAECCKDACVNWSLEDDVFQPKGTQTREGLLYPSPLGVPDTGRAAAYNRQAREIRQVQEECKINESLRECGIAEFECERGD